MCFELKRAVDGIVSFFSLFTIRINLLCSSEFAAKTKEFFSWSLIKNLLVYCEFFGCLRCSMADFIVSVHATTVSRSCMRHFSINSKSVLDREDKLDNDRQFASNLCRLRYRCITINFGIEWTFKVEEVRDNGYKR